jgi:hypothetical protein
VVREREFLVRGAIFAETRRTFEKPEAPAWEPNAETRVHDAIRGPVAEPDPPVASASLYRARLQPMWTIPAG